MAVPNHPRAFRAAFAVICKRAREAHYMSQGELARRMGIGWQQVAKWERGETTPAPARLELLASVFGLSADNLTRATELQVRLERAQANERVMAHRNAREANRPVQPRATRGGIGAFRSVEG